MLKSPSANHCTTLSGYIFITKACIDNRKKYVKWQYLLHMSSQYGERRPTNGWYLLASLKHPSKFQRVLRLGFVSARNGGHPSFAPCLADSCTGVLYIHLWGSCSLTEFCQLQNSLCVQLLRSPMLAALLHGTPAYGRQPVCGMVQGMELRNFCRGRHLYSAGRPSHWASAHILDILKFYLTYISFIFYWSIKTLLLALLWQLLSRFRWILLFLLMTGKSIQMLPK